MAEVRINSKITKLSAEVILYHIESPPSEFVLYHIESPTKKEVVLYHIESPWL